MAQVSYGTITITDTNDINRIYVEYCRSTSNQLSGTSVPDITRAWGETTPEWIDGEYIWQRAVVEKSGTLDKTYGTPVCITGAQGETGEQGPQGGTGAAGRSLTSTTTQYTTAATSATITQSNMGNYTWFNNVPDYNANTPAYWVRITNTYSNPSSTQYIIYKDNGITDAVKTSHDANTTAAAANSTANTANQTANTANSTANSANTKADQAVTNVNNLQNKLKYYWVNEVAHTNGVSGWTKPNYPAGTYAASGISGTTFDAENSSTYGYNTWYANGINLRYNAIKLGELTGSALTFYQPSTTNQGAKAMELSGSALKFYASNGTTVQAEFGGSKARVSGTINAYDGQIGNSEDNYWYIGNYLDYFENQSAIIKSHGTASIQLGDSNTWRIATNRIHTAWNNDSSSGDAFKLHFPVYDNKYWDSGLHLPTSANDKLLYIRNSSSSNTLTYLNEALEDQYTNRWNYLFYITNSGSIYAKNIYVLDDNGQATQIGGTDGVYLLKSGGTITGNLTVNGTLTGTLSGTATRVSKDLKIQLNGGTTEGTNQFTYNGGTAKTVNITKSSIGLSNVENTALSTWAGSSNLTTTKVGTLAAAAAKGVDTSLTTSTTSTNLPTSAAVVNLIKQYLPLTGGNVTGAVTFGSSVSADELTVGDLVVNGAASFTNNLQANTINGVAVGSSPKFTDTVTTVTTSGNGNAVTAITASNGKLTVTKGATFLTSYTETDPIFVASAAHGITSSDISNWNSKTSNTGTVTSVAASGSGGITISGSPITTNGTITIGLNLSTSINGLGEGSSPATRDDYIVAQYAGGGTTTTTYHRRKLSNIFAALNKSDITTALGYTPPTQDTNTHYTTHLYVNNNTTTNQNTTTALTNGNVYLHLYDDSTKRDSHKISGSGTVSVTSDTSGNIVITGSAHPTSLKNPNALSIKVYNGTSTSTNTSYDGSTANQSVSVAGTNAITGINSTTDGKLQLTLADGSQPDPISIKITATTSDSAASADKLNLSKNVGSLTQPVYFNANTGLPVATTYSLNKTVPSDAKFTDTWIAMVGATSSANGTAGYVGAPPKDGYNTKFLRADGTWVVPEGTYSLPLAANGTRGGVQIGYTANGKNYPVQLSSEKMYVNVPWENTWRGIQNNLTSDSTTDSLSAAQGKALANGSARDSTKLPLAGGTMTGALNTANNTWNKIGDDAQFGDINQAGKIGIKGINGATGIQFVPYSGSTGQTISIDGAGTMSITSNVSVANNLSSVWYNSYRWYANQNPNWWYRYSTTFTTSTVPTANWYIRVQLNCTWDPHLKPCVCMANYSNKAGVLYYEIDSHLNQDKWRAYLTNYSGTNFISTKRVMESVTIDGNSTNRMVLYFELAKPVEFSGSTPNGTFTIYSPVPIDSVTSVGAQTDMTALGFGENLHGANITITSGSLIGKATLDGSGNTITSTYLNKAGDTMTGTLALRPASGEGGQIELRASAASTTQAGIILDQYNSTFRIFGIPSADGSTKTGTGTPLIIDPYGKTITGGYTITGTLSGNATTATTLQTARTIFGKSFNGNANVAGQALVYGDYTATASSRYAHGGLQIREQDLVGSAQSDILYAPTIGFHWSGRIAASLIFHSDGIFYLRKQDGVTRATLDANLNGNAATATKATQDGSGNIITTKYVTIDTNQTITASQKTFNGATRWSITNSTTGSKYGACNYDATLDALVFSFGTI